MYRWEASSSTINNDVAYIFFTRCSSAEDRFREFMLSCILSHTESSLTETQGFSF